MTLIDAKPAEPSRYVVVRQRVGVYVHDHWQEHTASLASGLVIGGVRRAFITAAKAATAHTAVHAISQGLVYCGFGAVSTATATAAAPIIAGAAISAVVGGVIGGATNAVKVYRAAAKHHRKVDQRVLWKSVGIGFGLGAGLGIVGDLAGEALHHLPLFHHVVPKPPALKPVAHVPLVPPVDPATQAVTDAQSALKDTLKSGMLDGHTADDRYLRAIANHAIAGADTPGQLQHALKEISWRLNWRHHPTAASRALAKRLIDDGSAFAKAHKPALTDINSWMLNRDSSQLISLNLA